jgi:ribosomal protein S18 acetylase RimI-like enzyme
LVNEHSPIIRSIESADPAEYIRTFRGDLVGCVRVKRVSWYQFEVSHLVVEPAYRRQGIGYSLVNKAVAKIRELGGRLAQCTVPVDNEASIQLFKRAGFRRCETFIGMSGNEIQVWQRAL